MKAKLLRKLGKEQKGFTLIELLAVIVILGIISAIAIPLISNIINKSKTDSDLATARQIYDASRMYVISEMNGDFKGNVKISVKDLKDNGYLDKNIYLPSTKAVLDDTGSYVEYSATTGELTDVVLKGTSATAKTYTSTEVLSSKAATAPISSPAAS
jgi:type IV pilus assembly protein PilA